MSDQHSREIYFHVGLGKVASTYLQYRFFPKLKGIHYIQRTKYWNYEEAIRKSGHDRILISRELDRQLEPEVRNFVRVFPETRIIINLRRHDSWIASQYRRFVKNGMYLTFEEFIDIDSNKGFWKIDELRFFPKLQLLEKLTGRPPQVLFYDDLKEDPFDFYDELTGFVGATYDRSEISLKPVHTSYSEKQLKIIRKCRLYEKEPAGDMRNPVDWLRRRWRFLLCYSILYPAKLIPESWISSEPLIDPESLRRVRSFFEEDWRKCIAYAETSEVAAAQQNDA